MTYENLTFKELCERLDKATKRVTELERQLKENSVSIETVFPPPSLPERIGCGTYWSDYLPKRTPCLIRIRTSTEMLEFIPTPQANGYFTHTTLK
jgi:hypothetical protein